MSASSDTSPQQSWSSDRIALAVWVTGALIVTALLLKDLFFALLPF